MSVEPSNAASAANASKAFLERNASAAAELRAHHWLWATASPAQLLAAAEIAEREVAAAEGELLAELVEHNQERVAVGMPEADLDEFRILVWHLVAHQELMKAIASGRLQ